MRFNGFKRRLDRLELRAKGGECEGCTRTALMELTAAAAAREKHPDGDGDPGTIPSKPCPECGNPNPQIPMRVIDEIVADEEAMARAEQSLRDDFLRDHPTGPAELKAKSTQVVVNEQ